MLIMQGVARQSGFVFADALRLPLDFDPVRLQADLRRVAAPGTGPGTGPGWIDHFVRQHYEGDWSVLPLRIPADATHPIMMIRADPSATDFIDGPLLARAPYLRDVLGAFACELQVARLMRLTAGSVIKEHRDHDLAAEWGMARVHIPVTTNDAVDFRLNGRRIAMAAGSAWYLRLADPHSVANRGDAERVHLVIDCVVNDWLEGLLARGTPG